MLWKVLSDLELVLGDDFLPVLLKNNLMVKKKIFVSLFARQLLYQKQQMMVQIIGKDILEPKLLELQANNPSFRQ